MIEKHKSIALGVLVLAAVALAIILATSRQESRPAPPGGEQDLSQPAPQVRVMDSEQGTILAAFPSGFPVEAQAIALKSYRLIPANSLENQYTLEYLSRLTAADNSRMFKAYLRDAGFSLTGSTDQTNQTFLYATKGRNDLSIVIVKQNDQVRVTASYLIR